MGKASSKKPLHLSRKLVEIRTRLGLSQNGLIRQMGLVDELTQAEISAFERGVRNPPLHVLLAYARAVNLSTDLLIDDAIELPSTLPVPISKTRR
jgi:transcriptional regulator with XRE-family HTH domain